jgi:hypothetical protein
MFLLRSLSHDAVSLLCLHTILVPWRYISCGFLLILFHADESLPWIHCNSCVMILCLSCGFLSNLVSKMQWLSCVFIATVFLFNAALSLLCLLCYSLSHYAVSLLCLLYYSCSIMLCLSRVEYSVALLCRGHHNLRSVAGGDRWGWGPTFLPLFLYSSCCCTFTILLYLVQMHGHTIRTFRIHRNNFIIFYHSRQG